MRGRRDWIRASPSRSSSGQWIRSVIIHRFAIKSPFFMSLGAFRLKKAVLVVSVLVLVSAGLVSCGLYNSKSYYKPPSGLVNRVLASQGVTSSFAFGGLVIVNGYNDTLTRTAEISAGSNPGLMAESPTRNIVAAFDASSNSVFSVNTVTEQGIG